MSASLHKISTNIVQLIHFNSVSRKRSEKIQNFHHSAVLIGLNVHTKPGKSSLVDSLADEGMRITYKQVLEIRHIISNKVCAEFQERGIDHVVSNHVFISHLQHPKARFMAQLSPRSAVPISPPLFGLNATKADRWTKLSIPESFTEIRPTPEVIPEPPLHTSSKVSGDDRKHVPNETDTILVVIGKDSVYKNTLFSLLVTPDHVANKHWEPLATSYSSSSCKKCS